LIAAISASVGNRIASIRRDDSSGKFGRNDADSRWLREVTFHFA
jgi:hypothetical protein